MKKILYNMLFLLAFLSCDVENGNMKDSFEIAMDGYYRENLWADRISTTYNHHVRIITYNKPI